LLDILHLDCECVDGGRCEEGSYEPEFVDPYESQGEVAGSKFAAYYDNGEDRFYDGAKKFRDEFNDYWSYYYFRPAYENYFEEDSFDHADAVDLILFFGHGGTGTIATTDSSVTLYGSYGNLLGLKDLEYFATKSCLTATVAYCSDMYGHERYTAQEVNYNELTGSYTMDWISIFSGLHVYSGMNGLAYSSSDSSEDLSNKYANYLMTVGLPVVDAWQYAALDSNDWYLYTYNGCTMFDDPENSCSYEEFDCNRWEMYPATFYIDEKRSESLFMAAIPSIEEDDPVPGDPDYDIDFVYTYQSSTVPAFSLGYPLP